MADVSIIIPTKNEAGCIGETLQKTAQQLRKDGLSYEILVVDDASSDGTQGIVRKFSAKDRCVRLVAHPPPHAFGYSVRDGIRLARGKAVAIMMADLSDDPRFLLPMWQKLQEGYDAVLGSRFLPGSKIYGYSPLKLLSNRLFNLAVRVMLLSGTSDSSNSYKMLHSDVAKGLPLESRGFEVGPELLLRLLVMKAKMAEIPVSWSDRMQGSAKFHLGSAAWSYFFLFLRMLHLAYFGKGKR